MEKEGDGHASLAIKMGMATLRFAPIALIARSILVEPLDRVTVWFCLGPNIANEQINRNEITP